MIVSARCAALLSVTLAASTAGQSPSVPRDPERALLVTSDIANFWNAYDRAQSTTDGAARAYLDLYIRRGSPGLHDWVQSRLASGMGLVDLLLAKGWSKERLLSTSTAPL